MTGIDPDEEVRRQKAIVQVGELVASGGTLVVIAAARDAEDDPVEGPPWPLTGPRSRHS